MPTAGSILSPIPAADRAPSLLRITAVLSRDSRTASHTTSTPGRRRNDRAAIRKAEGGAGRWGPCDSSFLMLSTIVAVSLWSLPPRGPREERFPHRGPFILVQPPLQPTPPLDH